MVYIISQNDAALRNIDIMDTITTDKENFMLNGDKNGLSVLRVVLGEIQRDPDKDYSNENVVKILRALRKQTMKNPIADYLMIDLIDTYIGSMISNEEVEAWLDRCGYDNIFILNLGKKAYRIIGEAKKHFDGQDFSSDHLKNLIDEVLNDTN